MHTSPPPGGSAPPPGGSTPPAGDPTPPRGVEAVLAFLANYRVNISFFVVAGLVLLNWWQGRRVHDPLDLADALGLTGAVLVVAGALMRAWAAGILRKNQELATSGPYWFTRHPLYVGSFLIALGCAVVLGGALNVVLIVAVFAALYWPRMSREEATMQHLFGEVWSDYARRTGRLLPRSLPPRLRAPWSPGMWLHNREYYAGLSAVVVLALLHWVARVQAG